MYDSLKILLWRAEFAIKDVSAANAVYFFGSFGERDNSTNASVLNELNLNSNDNNE